MGLVCTTLPPGGLRVLGQRPAASEEKLVSGLKVALGLGPKFAPRPSARRPARSARPQPRPRSPVPHNTPLPRDLGPLSAAPPTPARRTHL